MASCQLQYNEASENRQITSHNIRRGLEVRPLFIYDHGKAALAQLVEHHIRNVGVGCSSHPCGTSLDEIVPLNKAPDPCVIILSMRFKRGTDEGRFIRYGSKKNRKAIDRGLPVKCLRLCERECCSGGAWVKPPLNIENILPGSQDLRKSLLTLVNPLGEQNPA